MELLENEPQWKLFLHHHGYQLRHQIGYGSFGDVFCVTAVAPQNDSHAKFALKRLVSRRNILDDEYVLMEIHSLLQLQHKNIVSLHEVFLTKNVACIVMELAPLGNLEMFFKNSGKQITKKLVALSFSQVLSAVEYCHGLFLAHRDINPTNVLVHSSCLVKLADFGLCFQCKEDALGDLILCADYLGQEQYSAPEVKRCEPFNAMSADVWSLGCLLSYLAMSSGCFDIDQSLLCEGDDQFNDNGQSETLDNAGSVKSTSKKKTSCKITNNGITSNNANSGGFPEYSLCRHGDVDKVTDQCVIGCFIRKLCRHSPTERPSVAEASRDWNKNSCVINDGDKVGNDNNNYTNTNTSTSRTTSNTEE